MSDPTACTILDYGYGPATPGRAEACGWPAARIIATTCRCGHSGTTGECEDHAEIPDEDRFCNECNIAGHFCPVDIRVLRVL